MGFYMYSYRAARADAESEFAHKHSKTAVKAAARGATVLATGDHATSSAASAAAGVAHDRSETVRSAGRSLVGAATAGTVMTAGAIAGPFILAGAGLYWCAKKLIKRS